MAAMPPVPVTIRVRLYGNDGGDSNIQNAWYFTYTQTASSADLNTLMGIVASSWSANLAPQYNSGYHLTQIQITDLASQFGAQVAESVSIAGTHATGPLTSGCAVVVKANESDHYRGGHARRYLAGRSAVDLADNNTWSAAFQSAISAGVQQFVNQIISAAPAGLGALKDVVVHRFGPSTLPPLDTPGYDINKKSIPLNPPLTHPITSYAANPQVASQRRRNDQTG